MWEAAQPLRLSRKERELLEAFVRAGNTPQKIALRIRIVLGSAEGVANHRLAAELGTSPVLRWRQRFEQARTGGAAARCASTGTQAAPDEGERRVDCERHSVQQAKGSDAVERTHTGPIPAGNSGDRLSRLEGASFVAASRTALQAELRSPVLSQVARHCRLVPESSGESSGVERG